ncbi:MAG: 8-oxo-dGTP diphosphatase MutT [Candidatus Melainabacteria bacterium HGW-Melainabacteria-1]|nr:MAG: 8-oxo-dGTP diphosphatase MutT [Candidatus Melainabacteria bacterium HGW-Melainabacteria-1]
MASVRALILLKGRILLIQRGSAISRPGQWCLPGGRIHDHESPEAAVVRETHEEVGLKVRVLHPLTRFGSCHYFRCVTDPPGQQIHLDPMECQASVWVEPDRVRLIGPIMDYYQLRILMQSRKW